MSDADLQNYDTTGLRLGKGDAVRPIGLHDLGVYSSGFAAPPATYGELAQLQAISWGMDGNDTLGDCTIAAADHVIAAANEYVGEDDPRPALQILEQQYLALSPKDTGCVISDVLSVWRSPGLFQMPQGPNKISLYAPFNQRSETEFQQVVAFTGSAYIGINCPGSAQQQFAKQTSTGQLVPWTVVPGSKVEGGHCIVAVGYYTGGLLCVTWGAVVEVTWAFIHKYCDEAWALLTEEVAERGADPLGLDVALLTSDLDALAPPPHRGEVSS